jgi:copper homeostasis protein
MAARSSSRTLGWGIGYDPNLLPMAATIQLEVCVESVESARAAEQGGATRVELCSSLDIGGLTPSGGLIAMVRRHIAIALHVLVRPRGGDFQYSAEEFEVIKRDILLARQLGANGVAIGLLDAESNIDVRRTRALVDLALPMPVTFHRAFDFTRNADEALNAVIETGAARILTSGGASTAEAGIERLRELTTNSGSRIIVMAAGKIRSSNVAQILHSTGVREVHANLATPISTSAPGPIFSLGTASEPIRTTVSPETVSAFVRAASEAF